MKNFPQHKKKGFHNNKNILTSKENILRFMQQNKIKFLAVIKKKATAVIQKLI